MRSRLNSPTSCALTHFAQLAAERGRGLDYVVSVSALLFQPRGGRLERGRALGWRDAPRGPRSRRVRTNRERRRRTDWKRQCSRTDKTNSRLDIGERRCSCNEGEIFFRSGPISPIFCGTSINRVSRGGGSSCFESRVSCCHWSRRRGASRRRASPTNPIPEPIEKGSILVRAVPVRAGAAVARRQQAGHRIQSRNEPRDQRRLCPIADHGAVARRFRQARLQRHSRRFVHGGCGRFQPDDLPRRAQADERTWRSMFFRTRSVSWGLPSTRTSPSRAARASASCIQGTARPAKAGKPNTRPTRVKVTIAF